MSSITETAICATTSPRWSRCRRRLPLTRVVPAESQLPNEPSRVRFGANDRMSATASVSASVKPSTIPSSWISLARGE